MKYLGKELSDYTLFELTAINNNLEAAEAKREEASKHEKFNKMEFPPPNPAFLELKFEIIKEIKEKQK